MSPRDRVALLAITALVLVPAALVGVPIPATVIATVAAALFSARRHSVHGVPFPLGDVGDRWRALLFGAPPSLL